MISTALLELIGGGVFGSLVSLFSMNMKNKSNLMNNAIKGLAAQSQATIDNTKEVNKSPFMAMTRRILALGIFTIVAAIVLVPMVFPETIVNIGQEVKTGGSYLFGLIDTTKTTVVYDTLKGAVMPEYVGQMFRVVIGTYMGASITKV